MRKWVAGVSLVIAIVAVARADSESERNSLMRDIEDRVKRIADKLNSFDGRRDDSYADDVLGYAREVGDLVSRLKDVAESDSKARQIVDTYPDYIRTFNDSMRYLKALKRTQFLADGVAERCIRDEADLQTVIRQYVGRPDEADEAASKLPAKGQDYGRTYAPLLDKLKDATSDFSSNVSSARFDISVSSSDPWNDVRSYYKDSAQRIQDYWKDHISPVDAACKRLALGEKHPDVEKALADLGSYTGNVKQTVRQLKKDYNAWLADARKLREMTEQDHKDLREVMCRQGVTEAEIKRKANEVADRWASQISSAYGTVLGQSDRIEERALSDKLKKYKGAREVLDDIRHDRTILAKIKTSDLQGSNNPRIKVKLEYGTNYHSSWSCSGKKEFEISSSYCNNPIRDGSGCKADCVVFGSTCEIIELKPDNDEAKAMGDLQRAAYEAALRKWFDTNRKELLETYSQVASCIRDNQIATSSRLETYKFCPSESEAKDFGDNLDGLSSDVSDSD